MGEFLKGPYGSAARIFVATVLGGLVTYLLNGGTFSGLTWGAVEMWVGTAVTVALPLIIAFLNPADTRFGKGS